MAVGRSVRSPKPVILRSDDAIDWPKSDWDEYVKSGFDASKLVVLPGQTPTTFTIAQPTHPQRVALDGLSSAPAKEDFLIRCCLRSLSNYVVIKPDGSTHIVDGAPPMSPVGTLGNVITDKWMDEFSPLSDQRTELAELIRINGEAPLPLSRQSGAGFGV